MHVRPHAPTPVSAKARAHVCVRARLHVSVQLLGPDTHTPWAWAVGRSGVCARAKSERTGWCLRVRQRDARRGCGPHALGRAPSTTNAGRAHMYGRYCGPMRVRTALTTERYL